MPGLLLVSAVAGFGLANSTFSGGYRALLDTRMLLAVGSLELFNKSFLLLVNDGLMALFFLYIGLELKREIVVGELSDARQAMLPIFAALGGMLVPALLYFAINPTGRTSTGWGIPMATDIAFALGILTVLGSKVHASLKVFLTAIAIVDDLGAILVIAIFYTAKVDFTALATALGLAGICIAANHLGVMRLSVYMLIGIPMWYFMLKSGVHATIAGVLLAMTIPLAPKHVNTPSLVKDIRNNEGSPLDSPAVFFEDSLFKWVGYLVIPIFAFCNSGVALDSMRFTTVSLGVIAGLVIGKPLGDVGATYLATRLKMAALPYGVKWSQIIGVGFLAGIGFTMSLFVSSLAFADADLNNEAKLAILIASLIAGTFGVFFILTMKSTAKVSPSP